MISLLLTKSQFIQFGFSFQDHHGEENKHMGGHHYHENQGHKSADGHDGHHKHGERQGSIGGHESMHKWSKSNHH